MQPPAVLKSVTAGWLHVTRPLFQSSTHSPPLTSSAYAGPCRQDCFAVEEAQASLAGRNALSLTASNPQQALAPQMTYKNVLVLVPCLYHACSLPREPCAMHTFLRRMLAHAAALDGLQPCRRSTDRHRDGEAGCHHALRRHVCALGHASRRAAGLRRHVDERDHERLCGHCQRRAHPRQLHRHSLSPKLYWHPCVCILHT